MLSSLFLSYKLQGRIQDLVEGRESQFPKFWCPNETRCLRHKNVAFSRGSGAPEPPRPLDSPLKSLESLTKGNTDTEGLLIQILHHLIPTQTNSAAQTPVVVMGLFDQRVHRVQENREFKRMAGSEWWRDEGAGRSRAPGTNSRIGWTWTRGPRGGKPCNPRTKLFPFWQVNLSKFDIGASLT